MTIKKVINEAADMQKFLKSPARAAILAGINEAVGLVAGTQEISIPTPRIKPITDLLDRVSQLIDETPPQEGHTRFGNPSYRIWFDKVQGIQLAEKLDIDSENVDEFAHYFQNSFGSRQRIDYGTGHELNFFAFILALPSASKKLTGGEILTIFSSYLNLCCKLIRSYNLEPAGSHGVWGLDDHFHIPYILGSAQLFGSQVSPKLTSNGTEVNKYAANNLYFRAITFIFEMKKGPFWEHSPTLYSVSEIPRWEKINSGMIKMYTGEVLDKFPVVQHFYCGNIYPLE